MEQDIIIFDDVNKRFGGIAALTDISFSIRRGEVHAIVGENGAGKSTLMNILSGIVVPDSGSIVVKGQPVKIDSPLAAKKLGISTVYQELKLCDNLNVVQNLYLGREEAKFRFIPSWDAMERKAQVLIKSLGIEIDVRDSVKSLSVAKMQIVEIAKALSIESDILLLDEPTSSLTIMETRKLIQIIQDMKKKGMTILFISHRLEEIFELADRISVMRNGQYLKTLETKDSTIGEIVNLIAGKDIDTSRKRKTTRASASEVVLEVRGLSRGKWFKDVSFELHKGEILGFYGLQGSGRTELLETLFGLEKPDEGEMLLYGQRFQPKTARAAINHSMGMVPEDRKLNGLFMNFNIWRNIAIIHTKRISKLGVIRKPKIVRMTSEFIEKFSIKCGSSEQMVQNLSGGNQQKVVLSKVLSTQPDILLLDEPTRGIDVGTKAEIFRILNKEAAEKNKSVIVVTSELSEVIAECDRVLVVRNGRICGELTNDDINEANILEYAFSG